MARNLWMILTGPLTVKAHNPLNEVKRKWIKRLRTAQQQPIVAAGNQCGRSTLPSTALCVQVSKLRVLPREASQAKGSQKRFELEQELGHILTA